jgi:hypothetical protein
MRDNHPRETGEWQLNKVSGYMEKRINGVHYYQHRYIMEQQLGRPLRVDEHVHHRDGNKANNVPENLEVMSESDHHKEHMTPERAKEMSILGHEARWGK